MLLLVTWAEFACPANQHPKNTIKKKKAHIPLRTSWIFACHVWQSYNLVILTIEWANLLHVLAAWSALLALFNCSLRNTCAKDDRLLIWISDKPTRSENPTSLLIFVVDDFAFVHIRRWWQESTLHLRTWRKWRSNQCFPLKIVSPGLRTLVARGVAFRIPDLLNLIWYKKPQF